MFAASVSFTVAACNRVFWVTVTFRPLPIVIESIAPFGKYETEDAYVSAPALTSVVWPASLTSIATTRPDG